jgi:hypothetical protein
MNKMTNEDRFSIIDNSCLDVILNFEFTDDLDAVIDSVLKPREDYFLGLHSKVKEIIETEIADYERGDITEVYEISFNNLCNWQKELFEHKKEIIWNFTKPRPKTEYFNLDLAEKALSLPNQHINLGLRQSDGKVADCTPPEPMFLENLKELCFPISTENIKKKGVEWFNDTHSFNINECVDMVNFEGVYTSEVIEWYKIFQSISFFEDFNDVIGCIVVNIFSYVLTGKYLIKE